MSESVMHALQAAALWSGLMILLMLVLSGMVVSGRRKHLVSFGDGGHPDLLAASRAFGNCVEYATPGMAALGLLALVSLATALWLASRYIAAFMRASNAIYDVPEGRPIWKTLPIRIGVTVVVMVLLAVSAFDIELGLPTAIAGLVTTLAVCAIARSSPLPMLRDVSWSVLPLVAGLFVLVAALDGTVRAYRA